MQKQRLPVFILILMLMHSHSEAQVLKSMEFYNQSITDILLSLAEATGTSIIPDETVNGTATFKFSESDFETALGLFLSSYKLFYYREGPVYKVSRVKCEYNSQTRLINLKADGVEVESLIRNLSRTIGRTILYDTLPRISLTVDIESLNLDTALEILTKRLPDFTLEKFDNYHYIKQRMTPRTDSGGNIIQSTAIVKNGERYSLALEKGRFLELIQELFRIAGMEYSLLTRTDTLLENLYFSDRDFTSLLRLILEQGNADYFAQNGVFYILEIQRRDIVRKLKETKIINLVHLTATDLPGLLPGELSSGSILKIDKNTNTVILNGTSEEITPLITFIELIDKPVENLTYRRFDSSFLPIADLLAIIPPRLLPTQPVTVPGSNAFILAGREEAFSRLSAFIASVDYRQEGYPIRLRYIRTSELLEFLPPSIKKEELVQSGDPNLFFFLGSADKRQLMTRELELIDRPRPQIRYKLLIVQYNKNTDLSYTRNGLTATSNPSGESNILTGELSNVLSLGFDVVSHFGYQFAASLSLQLGEKTAEVFADTTLNGLTGQEIKFQNTDTYRYQALERDDDTGALTPTGVAKEISSGLFVSLNGWVSGNDMITINVGATISKQNSTSTTGENALPSTSERVVNTQVRTPSGTPIVISGLIKEDKTKAIKKIPILGDIPILGWLFRNETTNKEKTEIVIYIVPYLRTEDNEPQNTASRMQRYYHTMVRGAIR